jgi:hypothetical protein
MHGSQADFSSKDPTTDRQGMTARVDKIQLIYIRFRAATVEQAAKGRIRAEWSHLTGASQLLIRRGNHEPNRTRASSSAYRGHVPLTGDVFWLVFSLG